MRPWPLLQSSASRRSFLLVLAAAGLLAAAATARSWGERVAESARWHYEHQPRLQRRDCSGLVLAILARAGLAARGDTRVLWAAARREKRLARHPRPGDLAFFDHTWDADGDGRLRDTLTHVAVVIEVAADGGVTMVHWSSAGISLLRMNLARAHTYRAGGEVVNDYLRKSPRAGDEARLAAELFRGFARPPRPHRR